MCREQLVKLPSKFHELTADGAAVLAISIDSPDAARRLGRDLGLPFPILSDPDMSVIRAYGMKGNGMDMADMGYVVIDKRGRIRARQIDREFGDHIGDIVRVLREAKGAT